MDFFTYNLAWMLFNVILALIPVVLVKALFIKRMNNVLKLTLFIFWLLFLPNTIYLITDIQYFPKQFFLSNYPNQLMLITMYGVLMIIGFVTFLYAIKAFEIVLSYFRIKAKNRSFFYVILNFLIGFAVVLGKFQRTQSWDVFVDPLKVLRDVIAMFYSPELIAFAILFGIFTNLVYFGAKRFKKI